VKGLRGLLLTAATFAGGTAGAQAGPCTAQIAEVDRYIERAARNPTTGPTAPQSIGAQLHHQPTPSSVASALSAARANSATALDRARKADAEGNEAACMRAVEEAKELYGLE